VLALAGALAPSQALAGAPAARYGSDAVAFHAGPTRPGGGGRYNAGAVALAPAPGGGTVAAVSLTGSERAMRFFSAVKVARNGTLDRRFGANGFARTAPRGAGGASRYLRGQVQAVATQRDGKILLAGYRVLGRGEERRAPVLERLLSNGAPDPSFGDGGVVTAYHVVGLGEWYSGVAVEADGTIVVSGAVTQFAGFHPDHPRPRALVRAYRPDGHIDRAFGHGGTIGVSDPPSGFYYTGMSSVQVLPGGGLLASGYSRYRLLLERLTADGRRVGSFGDSGLVTFGEAEAGCVGVCEWPGSFFLQGRKIVALASLNQLNETTGAVVRFLPDGRVDRLFGRHGIVRVRGAEQLEESEAIAPLDRGRFLVSGYGYESGPGGAGLTIAGFTRSGALDRSFGRHGRLDLGRGSGGVGYAALRERGATIVAGSAYFRHRGHVAEKPALLAFVRVR
jgi:uncharacterized delta-60 repeat protein